MNTSAEGSKLDKIGGFTGLAGIAVILLGKILDLGSRAEAVFLVLGLTVLIGGCGMIGAAQMRKAGKHKLFGLAIFLIILYNLALIYRAVFISGSLRLF